MAFGVNFGVNIFFFIKALLFGIATIAVIPREVYKKYFLYGFIFGALADLIVVFIMGPILNQVQYLNMGVFSFFGFISFWTPIAWMFTFMLFFYFLPVRRVFLYPYIAGFCIFGWGVGLILQHIGIFRYIGNYIYLAPFVFAAWFSLAAWAYYKIEHIKLIKI